MDVQKELLSKKVGDLTANELLLLMKAFLRQTDSSTSEQDCHNDTESEESKPGNSNTQNNEEPHVIISLYSLIYETDPDYYLEHIRTASIVRNLLYRYSESINAEWLYRSGDPEKWSWSRVKIDLNVFVEHYRNLPIDGYKKGLKILYNNWGRSCEEYLKHILTKRGFETQ